MAFIVLGLVFIGIVLWGFRPGSTRPNPLRTLAAVLLLPFAYIQAFVYDLIGRPYLPIVYRGPGPKNQQPLPETQPPGSPE